MNTHRPILYEKGFKKNFQELSSKDGKGLRHSSKSGADSLGSCPTLANFPGVGTL